MRRWTLIALIVLLVLLAAAAAYQIQLAQRRSELEERRKPAPSGP